jgi:hypothetical protein
MKSSVYAPHQKLPGRLHLALAAVVVLAGCGLRTDPEPLSRQIPPPQDVRIWQRENSVVVSWRVPPAGVVALYGAASSFEVSIQRLPLGCLDCLPVSTRSVDLRPDAKPLIVEGERAYYQFEHAGPPASWSARVIARLRRGASARSALAFVEDSGTVPAHVIQWERQTEGEPTIRFYWNPRRERQVRVLTKTGGVIEQDLQYRANVYLRVPTAPWPQTPANPAPVEGLAWAIQETSLSKGGQVREIDAVLRLVDRFGNEGPPSAPIVVPLGRGVAR